MREAHDGRRHRVAHRRCVIVVEVPFARSSCANYSVCSARGCNRRQRRRAAVARRGSAAAFDAGNVVVGHAPQWRRELAAVHRGLRAAFKARSSGRRRSADDTNKVGGVSRIEVGGGKSRCRRDRKVVQLSNSVLAQRQGRRRSGGCYGIVVRSVGVVPVVV